MYLVFAHLVRKFEIKLDDTRSVGYLSYDDCFTESSCSAEDMVIREYIVASWRGRGLRATLKERDE